jgi:hypothetical protein
MESGDALTLRSASGVLPAAPQGAPAAGAVTGPVEPRMSEVTRHGGFPGAADGCA